MNRWSFKIEESKQRMGYGVKRLNPHPKWLNGLKSCFHQWHCSFHGFHCKSLSNNSHDWPDVNGCILNFDTFLSQGLIFIKLSFIYFSNMRVISWKLSLCFHYILWFISDFYCFTIVSALHFQSYDINVNYYMSKTVILGQVLCFTNPQIRFHMPSWQTNIYFIDLFTECDHYSHQ